MSDGLHQATLNSRMLPSQQVDAADRKQSPERFTPSPMCLVGCRSKINDDAALAKDNNNVGTISHGSIVDQIRVSGCHWFISSSQRVRNALSRKEETLGPVVINVTCVCFRNLEVSVKRIDVNRGRGAAYRYLHRVPVRLPSFHVTGVNNVEGITHSKKKLRPPDAVMVHFSFLSRRDLATTKLRHFLIQNGGVDRPVCSPPRRFPTSRFSVAHGPRVPSCHHHREKTLVTPKICSHMAVLLRRVAILEARGSDRWPQRRTLTIPLNLQEGRQWNSVVAVMRVGEECLIGLIYNNGSLPKAK
ncbi:hypothetical protein EDD16DRAFT_1778291 [Pisolithus croceorrhizus]|nr:hypothetical protein EDD16DRAFT_1778291 [Pisolithus croceorrhizus]KAI6133876.1 hypothetical protein EV401DRAFT_2193026 [Pisolithus croceorrhizus]KAI6161941.1 hypothetical protein EDD17DRAFT_1896674 [Pisolithus thermaeus]